MMDIYGNLIEVIKEGMTNIVTSCVTVAGAVLPIGLGLLGLGKIFDVAKRFFTKATEGYNEYEDTYEYYKSGQRDIDYDYDIDG